VGYRVAIHSPRARAAKPAINEEHRGEGGDIAPVGVPDKPRDKNRRLVGAVSGS
jgi:hypothetical protein